MQAKFRQALIAFETNVFKIIRIVSRHTNLR